MPTILFRVLVTPVTVCLVQNKICENCFDSRDKNESKLLVYMEVKIDDK